MKTLAALLTIVLLAGCAAEKKTKSASAVEEIASPTGDGAAEPFLFATRDGGLLLSWLEPVAGTDRVALRFARQRGGRWSAARTIVERNDLFVNWADFPSIVEDANGALYAHWLQKSGAGTYAYDVRMSTSTDGGATWRESFVLNRDGKQAEHGFVSLAPLPDGGVGAAWLDGRNMTAGGDHDGHEAMGDMTVRYAVVDAQGAIRQDSELDARACECCGTGMTMTAGGPVIVYRDRSAEEIRDIAYVRREANGWSAPRPLHADGWKIEGCPVNGPQIDALGGRTATAWFTAAQERQRVLAAFSADGGATFGNAIAVDDGKPAGRVDVVMLDENTAVVSWLEQTAAGAEIRARRVTAGGGRGPSVKVADSATARAAGFARMARAGDDLWIAWTEHTEKTKRVHIARARV